MQTSGSKFKMAAKVSAVVGIGAIANYPCSTTKLTASKGHVPQEIDLGLRLLRRMELAEDAAAASRCAAPTSVAVRLRGGVSPETAF